MRYCPYCHRWNAGRPQLCFYCGRTWRVRLCPRGHENPADAQFCGSCGSADLSDTAGPRSVWIWLTRIAVLGLLAFLVSTIPRWRFHLSEAIISYIMAIILLLIGSSLSVSLLSGALQRPISFFIRAVKRMGIKGLQWCWEKLKLIFS